LYLFILLSQLLILGVDDLALGPELLQESDVELDAVLFR
jgi:hypothetical protein